MFEFDATISSAVVSGDAPASPAPTSGPLTPALLDRMHRYWSAANYLTIGQIYLQDNPLLREPLLPRHIKPRLLGHWGTSPGLSFVYVHLNRLIREQDANVIFLAGPGHGGPAVLANVYLEGTYSEIYPHVSQDLKGCTASVDSFLRQAASRATSACRRPDRFTRAASLATCSPTPSAPLSTIRICSSRRSSATAKRRRGRWQARGRASAFSTRRATVRCCRFCTSTATRSPVRPCGAARRTSSCDDASRATATMCISSKATIRCASISCSPPRWTRCYERIRAIQKRARTHGGAQEARWPAIVLRTPKGWTGPKVVHDLPIEGTFRAHQVPLADVQGDPEELALLEAWMRSYHPERLFDREGRLLEELRSLAPDGDRRMGANPHANGGRLRVPLDLPPFTDYALPVEKPATERHESTRCLGQLLRDVFVRNREAANFRLMCPDETNSNRLGDVFAVENRCYQERTIAIDDHVSPTDA